MSGSYNHLKKKWTILILVVALIWGDYLIFPQKTGLDGLFQWAIKDYLDGKYREVTKDLGLLLSYCDDGYDELKGKIYLLLGAVYEQLGDIARARRNYLLSYDYLENPSIDGIDLTTLKEYQHIIMKRTITITRKVIEKPALKSKKKKRISLLSIVLGGTLLTAVVIAVVLNKEKAPDEVVFAPDYDTRELGIEWVRIPGGEFLMGDNFNEGESDEQPMHAVFLSEYYISKYEVTFEQYDRFCEETGRYKPDDQNWGRGNRPVITVSRADTDRFCEWLSLKTGKRIVLPTEAQWEKAARGIDQRRYPWGNSPSDCTKANYGCDYQTHLVGSHPAGASPYGLHDMAGNVSEWCRDAYRTIFYNESSYHDPVYILKVISSGSRFVIRGGSWNNNHEMGVRAADRAHLAFTNISNAVGFRLVLEK